MKLKRKASPFTVYRPDEPFYDIGYYTVMRGETWQVNCHPIVSYLTGQQAKVLAHLLNAFAKLSAINAIKYHNKLKKNKERALEKI